MQRISAVACVATLGVAASACGDEVAGPTPSTERRASGALSGTIRFQAENGFFTIRPDGSGRRRIEIDDAYYSGEYEPCAWSPDRQQLACVEGVLSWGGGIGISLFGVDGSGPRDLTAEFDASGFLDWPSWSPDGRRIAFLEHSEDLGGPFLGDLYAVDVRSGKVGRLTNTPGLVESEHVWSPDGTRIAFGDEHGGVFVVELATGRTRRLADGYSVVWSPDGTALGYVTAERAGEPAGVWVVELAAGRKRRLATGFWGSRGGAEWSPDGTTIAYAPPVPRSALALIDADGSGEPRIITSEDWACCPSWSPDGTQIAYTTGKGSEQRLVVADADGREPRVLVHGCCPEWGPADP